MVLDLKQKKIALWGPFRGRVGTEKAVINYARALQKTGCDVVIIQLIDEFDEYRTEFNLLQLWPKSFGFVGKTNLFYRRDFFVLGLLSYRRLERILRVEKFDIVISFLMAAPLIKALRLLNNKQPKLIISAQGYPKFLLKNDNFISRLENKVRETFWKNNYEIADKILLMTEHTARQISLRFPHLNDKINTVPNPLFDRHAYEENKRLTTDIAKVFFVGRFSYQKDFQLFADTTRIISENSPLNFEFHVFGDFPRKIQLSRKFSHIVFHGYVRDFWQTLQRDSDIHLITARWEDPGHAMLEGLAYRYSSVVVDRDSPHVDLARKLSIPVVSANSQALAAQIITMSKSTNSARLSEDISNSILDMYGVEKFAKNILDIIMK